MISTCLVITSQVFFLDILEADATMGEVFKTRRRVEFRDTDMARIVHFSVFFTYMEEAEHQLLRHLGLGVISDIDGQKISFPRVAAKCNYRNAIRFEEEIDIEVAVQKIGTKSVTYAFKMFRADVPVADGEVTTVCCRFDNRHDGRPESMPIPASVVQLLTRYLVEQDA